MGEIVQTHEFDRYGVLQCPTTSFTLCSVDKTGAIPENRLPWICEHGLMEPDEAGAGVGVVTAFGADGYALREAFLANARRNGNGKLTS